MTPPQAIVDYARHQPEGTALIAKELPHLGPRATVDQPLDADAGSSGLRTLNCR